MLSVFICIVSCLIGVFSMVFFRASDDRFLTFDGCAPWGLPGSVACSDKPVTLNNPIDRSLGGG